MTGFFNVPTPINENITSYAPNTKERKHLQDTIAAMRAQTMDIPMYIGGKHIRTNNTGACLPPHDHQHILANYHKGAKQHVTDAINAALAAKAQWSNLPWEHRAAIFLKAAELVSGPYRLRINAATMLGQSKSAFQAEIDSACEFADFLRFNVKYMTEIYAEQPISSAGVWNRLEQRSLEGFVYALTPFNFTAIAGNLPSSAAMMGNVVVWKPSNTQIYSANIIMQIFEEAGVPAGVINLVYVSGPDAAEVIFKHADFAGIHFTGSTAVFQDIWKAIGNNIHNYKSYPRIVGETGGKDFILLHPTADVAVSATALTRASFEYQGQKCSACSRAYVPASMWPALKERLIADVKSIKIGGTEDFSNFFNAVIDEKSFDKLASYIDAAKTDKDAEIVVGGTYDKSKGYFVHPTIIQAHTPTYVTMCTELFGPVLTIYVYADADFEATLDIIDATSTYALTGAIISNDRYSIDLASKKLANSAGNFYINDKCTGAVVGQQPFGGGRASGTNDKAGSKLNLLRWVSPRTIKETFTPPTEYAYPFMQPE